MIIQTEKEAKHLKNQVEDLTHDITKNFKSYETFHKIMGSQSRIFDKAGIWFKSSKKSKDLWKLVYPHKKKKECSLCKNQNTQKRNAL